MENNNTILSVMGLGVTTIKPNMTIFRINVTGREKNYKLAKEKLEESVVDIYKMLDHIEVDRSYISIGYMNISPHWVYPPNNKPKYKDGYDYHQVVSIRYPKSENLLGKLISLDLPYECNIWHDIENPNQYKNETLSLAAKNAKEKAEIVSHELNLKIVGIDSVSIEHVPTCDRMFRRPSSDLLCEKPMSSGIEEDCFAPEEEEISAEVEVRYIVKYVI